jgi:transposase
MKNKYLFRARISERQFRGLLRLYCADVCALTAAQLAGVNKNTAHQLYTRWRARVCELTAAESQPFTGEVEVDESYFGPSRVRGKRGRGAEGKIPVIGLLKRGGNVYVKIVPDCSHAALRPIIRGQVLAASTIYTDGWRSYDGLVLDGFRHHRIHHHANQFARGKNHVNGIESFWSFAKLRMAKMRGLRKTHFLAHLLETQWRWNHRRDNRYKLLLRHLTLHPLS